MTRQEALEAVAEAARKINSMWDDGWNFSDDVEEAMGNLGEALAALAAAEPDGWRPIETAPKTEEEPIIVAHIDSDRAMYQIASWGGDSFPYWDNWLNGGSYGLALYWEPTHWCPLLPPPTSSVEGKI